MKKIIVTYDIRDDRRRNKVFKEMKSWGEWVQFSVFECVLLINQIDVMLRRLNRIIDTKEDSIRIYYFPMESKVTILGEGKPIEYRDNYVL